MVQLATDVFNRCGVVHVHEYRPQQIRCHPGPVLEWFLNEVAQRHDQPPQIPDAHYHECGADLFDATPFTLDNDDIVETDRLRKSELQAS